MKKTLIILVLIVVFTMSSCDSFQKQIKEESVENIVGKILGEEVDVTIISPTIEPNTTPKPSDKKENFLSKFFNSDKEGDITWPDDIPTNVPKLDIGIHSKVKTPNGVILDFSETEIAIVEDYIKALKRNFNTVREDNGSRRIDSSYKKDDIIVNVYWDNSGSFSLMITWD